jgi:hypothetical protein
LRPLDTAPLRLLLLTILAGCTFPSPDIAEPCAAPASCETNAKACGHDAQVERDKCEAKPQSVCAMNPEECECERIYGEDFDFCVTQCIACGEGEGCGDATDSCKAFVTQG